MADLYFSEAFEVSADVLASYGAFNISVVSDLPVFVDPFLLFNSEKPEYRLLHEEIIDYLLFLKSKASASLEPGLVAAWYRFKEVKQNWLGFTVLGNEGQGLGKKFASSLNTAFQHQLRDFGEEEITDGTHLEKVCLIRAGVGRDNVSDFTTNLIKDYLLRFTETFAKEHLDPSKCAEFPVVRARFNYDTESWETRRYYLPRLGDDFVILTPTDILTRDETWINHGDMISRFSALPEAVPDEQLRAQINSYFQKALPAHAKAKQVREAAAKTIEEFPELIDYYVRLKEETGDRAASISSAKVSDTLAVFVEGVQRALAHLEHNSNLKALPWTSYEETLARVHAFKEYVENQDGYLVINRNGKAFSTEREVQLFFGLLWRGSVFDVNREPNNGRGPVDFKVSYGSGDKSLIEFKLGSSSSLRRNLENQVAVYEAANQTRKSVKVIIVYTATHAAKVRRVLKELKLENEESVVVVDARRDNKTSASKV